MRRRMTAVGETRASRSKIIQIALKAINDSILDICVCCIVLLFNINVILIYK